GYNNYDISYTNGVLLQTYNIKYELNGGTNPPNNPNTYDPNRLPLLIKAPTKAGYDFLGWTVQYANGDSVTTPTKQYTIPEGTTGDIILTAHWTEIDTGETEYYTVTYVGNGHTSGTGPIDTKNPYEYESLVLVLGQGTIAKEGYTFLGWSTNPNADTATYTVGSTFTITDDVTLFAVWKQNTPPPQYSVTYRPGLHGTFEEQTTSGLLYGDLTPVAPNVMGQAGWKFIGWSPTPSAIVTGNAIYIAQWEQDQPLLLVVRFVDWDGTLLKSQSVSYGGDATAPQNPSRTGYTFKGWDRSFTNVVEDITVTALYTKDDSGASNTPTPSTTPPSTTTTPPTTPPTNNGGNNNNGGNERDVVVASWAFVNLALSIAGVILVIIAVVYILLQDKRKQKQANDTGTGNDDRQKQGEASQCSGVEKQKRRNSKWLIVAVAMAIAGVVIFLLTEDLSLPMRLLDKWTIFNAIVFGLVIVGLAFVFRHKDQSNKQQDSNAAYNH
ncbi:MAG: InlB B-repeat-containing protein, partial [Candidatus Bathyarchaeota archaeon]|nr:InlB B-repeat-containing protein [Candidatus Termiticorpusculum sp.]